MLSTVSSTTMTKKKGLIGRRHSKKKLVNRQGVRKPIQPPEELSVSTRGASSGVEYVESSDDDDDDETPMTTPAVDTNRRVRVMVCTMLERDHGGNVSEEALLDIKKRAQINRKRELTARKLKIFK